MKIKATIWFEDPDLDELTDLFKQALKNELEQYFVEAEKPVKQIEIEESNFED